MADRIGIVTNDLGPDGMFYDAVLETPGLSAAMRMSETAFFVLAAGDRCSGKRMHQSANRRAPRSVRPPIRPSIAFTPKGLLHGARNDGDAKHPPFTAVIALT